MSSDRKTCWAVRLAMTPLVLAASSCMTTSVNGGQALSGRWGGEQIELSFDDAGDGRIALPCASATIEGPVTLDVGGHWMKSGTYTQGSGAPPPAPPIPIPANISGRLDADGTLWISLATSEGMKVENLKLHRDRAATLYFCP